MNYIPKTKPRQHQQVGNARLRERREAFALLMEMGTGKSKVTLDEFGERELSGDLDDMLIIAPAGSYRNWDTDRGDELSEFNKHLSEDLRSRMLHTAWVSGSGVRAKKALENFLDFQKPKRPRIFMINVEALSRVKSAQEAARKFLTASGRRSMIVVDESTVIRNKRADRTKFITELGKLADSRRILTGLVSPKSPEDLFSQFWFLDWRILGFDSFLSFRSRYVKIRRICMLKTDDLRNRMRGLLGMQEGSAQSSFGDGFLLNRYKNVFPDRTTDGMPREKLLRDLMIAADGFGREQVLDAIERMGGYVQTIPKVEGFQNEEELWAKIAPYSYRVLKDDCLDLPPKIYQRRDVELSPEQRQAYDDLVTFFTTELGRGIHVSPTNVLDCLNKLHQICCGHVMDEERNIRDIPMNRINDMMEVLEDHSGKATIWANEHRYLDKIIAAVKKEYGDGSIAEFSGRNKNVRDREQTRFLNEEKCRFLASTQGAGGRGNTWVVPSLVIYFSNDYDLEKRLQSEDRHHRDGLRHSVTYVDLIARGTVQEKQIYALRNKLNLASIITGDNYREWLV